MKVRGEIPKGLKEDKNGMYTIWAMLKYW